MTHSKLIRESERNSSTRRKASFDPQFSSSCIAATRSSRKVSNRRTKSNSYSCNFRPSPHPHLPLVHLSDWNNERVKFFCASRRIGMMIKTIGNKEKEAPERDKLNWYVSCLFCAIIFIYLRFYGSVRAVSLPKIWRWQRSFRGRDAWMLNDFKPDEFKSLFVCNSI